MLDAQEVAGLVDVPYDLESLVALDQEVFVGCEPDHHEHRAILYDVQADDICDAYLKLNGYLSASDNDEVRGYVRHAYL